NHVKVVYREKKKPDNRQYETVTVKQTKTRKVIKAHEVAAPQEWKIGQHIILKTGFTCGCHRGAIYEIVSLDHDRVDCLKMGRKLDKHVTSYTQRGNRFCARSEEHTSELQSRFDLVCRLLLEKKKKTSDEKHGGQ